MIRSGEITTVQRTKGKSEPSYRKRVDQAHVRLERKGRPPSLYVPDGQLAGALQSGQPGPVGTPTELLIGLSYPKVQSHLHLLNSEVPNLDRLGIRGQGGKELAAGAPGQSDNYSRLRSQGR